MIRQPHVVRKHTRTVVPFRTGWRGKYFLLGICFAVVTPYANGADSVAGMVEGFDQLPLLYRVSETLYSGGQPKSEEAFAQLKRLGIRTIVNVDGAQPDLEMAKKYGLTYVHIPIGYDSIPDGAAASMAKALRLNDRPFYIHCHHGRHRGPAMAAIAVQLETGCGPEGGVEVLRRTGTSPDYDGLWRVVRAFTAGKIAGLDPDLYEAVPVGTLATEMAAIDRIWDRIKWCEASGWQTPEAHPDVTPAHEALMLNERLRELVRLDGDFNDELLVGLRAAEDSAKRLYGALKDGDAETANKHFALLKKGCKSCHVAHRD